MKVNATKYMKYDCFIGNILHYFEIFAHNVSFYDSIILHSLSTIVSILQYTVKIKETCSFYMAKCNKS